MNHSCDPNVWMLDQVTLVTRREIEPGGELTADYALWEADEGWVGRWECRCGASRCRGRVTGQDWRSRELQERYRGHFSPFIERLGGLGVIGLDESTGLVWRDGSIQVLGRDR